MLFCLLRFRFPRTIIKIGAIKRLTSWLADALSMWEEGTVWPSDAIGYVLTPSPSTFSQLLRAF